MRKEHLQQSVKFPDKVMFWGCFSHEGPGALTPIEGMMNSETYKRVILSKAIPEMRKTFPNEECIFQHDLAPCHTSKTIKKVLSDENIKVLSWPGNSPDLNPIENLWSIVKRRMCKRDCSTRQKMIEAVIQVWFHDPEIKNICKNLVNSMTKRVTEVIKARGGHIRY